MAAAHRPQNPSRRGPTLAGMAVVVAAAALLIGLVDRDGPPVARETAPGTVTTAAGSRVAGQTTEPGELRDGGTERVPVSQPAPPPDPAVLTVRILDPNGQPLASHWVDMFQSWRSGGWSMGRTDRDGLCRFPLGWSSPDRSRQPVALPAAGEYVEVELLQGPAGNGRDVNARTFTSPRVAPHARATFAWPAPGVDVDLGTLVLEHAPLLVAGLVVDEADRPVPADRVHWVLRCRARAAGRAGLGEPLRLGAQYYEARGEHGRFALHGHAPPDEQGLQLWARSIGDELRMFEPIEVPVGAQAVMVRIPAESRLETRVVLRGGAQMESLRVSVDDGSKEEPVWGEAQRVKRTQRGDEVELAVTHVRPGRHDVVFRLGDREVLRVERVEFPSGAAASDPRLLRAVIGDARAP